MPDPPPPPIRMKPDFVEGEACDWCWKWISPGSLLRNKRMRTLREMGRGTLHFCDDYCRNEYVYHGSSLYALGRSDEAFWPQRKEHSG